METETIYLNIGDRGQKDMPLSEACLSMGVYGDVMDFEITSDEMVQLYVTEPDVRSFTKPFGAPITLGEAGIYRFNEQFYYYF